MDDECTLPEIITDFDKPTDNSNTNELYVELIKKTLIKILPQHFFSFKGKDKSSYKSQHKYFDSLVPFASYSACDKVPSNVSFFTISKFRPNAFKFFYEMISRWLIPGKRMNVLLMYAADFVMPDLSSDVYTVCEIMIQIQTEDDLSMIVRNLPIIETEIKLGVESSYYAQRILEVKGLSSDEKTAFIQEHIAFLVNRLPQHFDYDVFNEMQHVLVICRDAFKAARKSRHLSKIISVQYLFRKDIWKTSKIAPEKRHLRLKMFKSDVFKGVEKKRVLSVLVGINLLKDKEIFEEVHLVKAIQNYVPSARAVEGSFFANKKGNETIFTLYLEVEKTDSKDFSADEIKVLRRELPSDLEGRIEHLMHPVFMPRNEEEVMRNILSLSSQIKYVRDLPQVFITFDEQAAKHLYFTVAVVRVNKQKMISIKELFKKSNTPLKYIHDRCKTVGYLRKKYKKEATVFRVKLKKETFLRYDHSIDLYKARQNVVDELTKVIGEFRDFNGGMISKQNELLNSITKLLKGKVKYKEALLENFFYSLQPVIMRTVLEPEILKTSFLMLLEIISDKDSEFKFLKDPDFVFAVVCLNNSELEERLNQKIASMHLQTTALATSYTSVRTTTYVGYIYRTDDLAEQNDFCNAIQEAVSLTSML